MCSYTTHNRKFQKNSKKIRKHHRSFFSSQNRMGMAEKERKKKSFRWVSTRPGKEKAKKIAKQFKKLENTIIAIFKPK